MGLRGFVASISFLLGGVCVGFGSTVSRRVVGIPVGAGCAALVAGLSLCCCGEWEGVLCVVSFCEHQDGIVEAFDSTSTCLSGLLGVVCGRFPSQVDRFCPNGLRLGGADTSEKQASFLDLNLSVEDGFVAARV